MRDILDLGVVVRVRVREILPPHRFRWPVVFDCISPDVSQLLTMPPPTYPPIIFYADETEEEAAVRPHSAIAQQRALYHIRRSTLGGRLRSRPTTRACSKT